MPCSEDMLQTSDGRREREDERVKEGRRKIGRAKEMFEIEG